MEKYGNKGPVAKFFHKNTGFIVAAILITSLYLVWSYTASEMYFFETWPCWKLNEYLLTSNQYGFPPHDELTEEEHTRLHEIYRECGTPEMLAHK